MSDYQVQGAQRLALAARRRREEAVARANRAIMGLENRGQVVTFTSVSAAANVSKDFLYKNPALRAMIMDRRLPGSQGQRPGGGSSRDSQGVKLEVALAAIKRLRAEVDVLRAENARLQGDLDAIHRRSV